MAKLSKRQPKSEKAQTTKQAVLEATAHILLKNGLEGLNTNSIAKKAGVSIGSVYQYYESKEEILLELLEDLLKRKQQRIREAVEISMLTDSIETIIDKVVDAVLDVQSDEEARLEMLLIPVSLQNSARREVVKLVENFEQFAKPALKALLIMKRPQLLKRDIDIMIFVMMQTIRGIQISLAFPWGKDIERTKLKVEVKRAMESFMLYERQQR